MATLLVLVIFTAYIGLGVPDSLFGAAWPAIYVELGLPLSSQSAVTIIVSLATVISSLLSNRLINRFGTNVVTAVSTTVTALALLCFTFSNHLVFLCLSAIPLGLGAGAIDVAQNTYVAKHYNARIMNFLHCFYGVGVAVSPILMSIGLKNYGWRMGYFLAFIVQAIISILTIVALPLWKKVHPIEEMSVEEKKERNLSLIKLSKNPAVLAMWGVFIFSCGIESICTSWSSTFFVTYKGLDASVSAQITALYFVGLTLGRVVSGIVASRVSPQKLITCGSSIIVVAIILLALPIKGTVCATIGLTLVGFGVGPIYPNFTYLTPIIFGEKKSQAVIGSQMALTYVSVMLSPLIFGLIAEKVGTVIFPYMLILLFALFVTSATMLKVAVKKGKNIII